MENENKAQPSGTPVVKKVEVVKKTRKETLVLGLITLAVVLLGVGTGYLFSGKKGSQVAQPGADVKVTQDEAGVEDEAAFPDSAEGELVAGGIDGEGTHHLEREGGASKYVYLTSTVIDLEGFVGKKVTVWGQTTTGQKAGWLMDVGKVKVVK